jgi:hypothetical protein
VDVDVVRVGPISSRLISTFGKCERDTDVGRKTAIPSLSGDAEPLKM